MHDQRSARTYDWFHVVRRARLGRTTKAVALLLASYADPDGTRVFPGIPGLAVAGEVDYKTIQKALAKLRSVGLIELVRRAGRRGQHDEYRLILHEDLLERVVVLTPTQFDQEAARQKRPPGNKAPQPTPRAEVDVDNADPTVDKPAGSVDKVVDNAGCDLPTSAHGTDTFTPTSAHATTDLSPRHDPTPIDHATTATSEKPPAIDTALPGPQLTTARAQSPTLDPFRPNLLPSPTAGPDSGDHTRPDASHTTGAVTFLAGEPPPRGAEPSHAATTTPNARASPARPQCPHGRTTRRRPDGTPRCPDCRAGDSDART